VKSELIKRTMRKRAAVKRISKERESNNAKAILTVLVIIKRVYSTIFKPITYN